MISLETRHLELVRRILETFVPEYEVWVFGSRATGRNVKPFSDLDLAIITDKPLSSVRSATLLDAFSESDLPFKVDVLDWADTSLSFRQQIERDHVVIV